MTTNFKRAPPPTPPPTPPIIHNTTRTVFSLKDRIKILFGGESITYLTIETDHEICLIKKSYAKTHVYSRLFDWRISNILSTKSKKGMYINSVDTCNR